ncbi:MAG: hypothetical protein RI906_673, partial [Pseudomonadota bacterium]
MAFGVDAVHMMAMGNFISAYVGFGWMLLSAYPAEKCSSVKFCTAPKLWQPVDECHFLVHQ